jgi:16S rRNA (cytosine967-C5)-methyltransferase
MRNEGRLMAHDVGPDRLELIKSNCARLGVTCVQTISSLTESSPPFDRILIDAPCSNTGVMRRRVELRWRIRPEELERLRATQLDLLMQSAPLLKPGGTLVYSTCSLEPEENSQVVDEFLKQRREFNLESQHELLPFIEAVDGAYVAKLRRS